MRIDHLRYLVAVAEKGSIRHAADHLYISPQGLSQAIHQLENQLGLSLLNRTGNRVTLTEEGLLTVEKARILLSEYDEFMLMIDTLAQDPSSNRTEFTFLLTPFFASTNLSDVIIKFCIKNPKFKIAINEKTPTQFFEELKTNRKAFGVYSVPSYKLEAFKKELRSLNFIFEPFYESEQTVCVSRSSPLAKKKSISPSQLLNYPLAILDLGQNPESVSKVFEKVGPMNVFIKTSNDKLYHDTISCGLAVGFSNTFMENCKQNDSIVSIPVNNTHNWILGWIYPKEMEEIKELLQIKREIMKSVERVITRIESIAK